VADRTIHDKKSEKNESPIGRGRVCHQILVMSATPVQRQGAWAEVRETLIVKLAQQGNSQCWNEFMEQYGNLIYRIALGAGLSHADAQDFVQEIALNVQASANDLADRTKGSPKAWLRQLVRWRLIDWHRKNARERLANPVFKDQLSGTSSTAPDERLSDPEGGGFNALWDKEWNSHLYNEAMRRLKSQVSLKDFQVFHLRVVDSVPPAEIAKLYGIAESTVDVIVHRLRGLLKAQRTSLEASVI
jgi:RNA polymerase sigma factor (sigma-70 family)